MRKKIKEEKVKENEFGSLKVEDELLRVRFTGTIRKESEPDSEEYFGAEDENR